MQAERDRCAAQLEEIVRLTSPEALAHYGMRDLPIACDGRVDRPLVEIMALPRNETCGVRRKVRPGGHGADHYTMYADAATTEWMDAAVRELDFRLLRF